MSGEASQSAVAGNNRLQKASAFLLAALDHSGTALMATGAILLGFGLGHWIPFTIGAAVTLGGVVLSSRKVSEYRRLEAARAQSTDRADTRTASLGKILENALCLLMDDLSAVDFSQARVSVYRHQGNQFYRLMRVSKSQELRKSGRAHYSDSEGVIGVTWDKGLYSVTGLPKDRQEWNTYCVANYKMEADSVQSIHMQSLSFVGMRLDREPSGQNPVGILILESLNPRGVNSGTIDTLKKSSFYAVLQPILIEAIQCLDEEDATALQDKDGLRRE